MDFLPKRRSKAFDLFCQALEKTNQSHLALQLRQEDDGTLRQTNVSQSPAPHSKQNVKAPLKKVTQLCMLDLGSNVYGTANLCENVVQIHIRQYEKGNSKPYPTKKGIVMSLMEWSMLENFLNGMEEAVKNYSTRQIDETWYLGSNLYATAYIPFLIYAITGSLIRMETWYPPPKE